MMLYFLHALCAALFYCWRFWYEKSIPLILLGELSTPLQLSVLQTQPGSWKSFHSWIAITVQHIKLSPHLLLCHLIKRLLQENLWDMICPADITELRHSPGSLKIKCYFQLDEFCSLFCRIVHLPAQNCPLFSTEPFCHFFLCPLFIPALVQNGYPKMICQVDLTWKIPLVTCSGNCINRYGLKTHRAWKSCESLGASWRRAVVTLKWGMDKTLLIGSQVLCYWSSWLTRIGCFC